MAYHPPQVPLSTARDLAYRALVAGTGDAAPLHGDCERPIDRELRGVEALYRLAIAAMQDPFVDSAPDYGWLPGREPRPEPPKVRTVVVSVRCRKCPACLNHKRRMWTARAIAEVRQSSRTWFGTLTVAPNGRFWASQVAARASETRRAERWGMLTPPERTRAIAQVLAPEVTKWLKRVRAEEKAAFRYLLVVEPHLDHFPHFHLLLHERDQPVRKSVLERQWGMGVSHWRLIDKAEPRQAGYCCKYIAKSPLTRVRASGRYGQVDADRITELVSDAANKVQMVCSTLLAKDQVGLGPHCSREQSERNSVETETPGL